MQNSVGVVPEQLTTEQLLVSAKALEEFRKEVREEIRELKELIPENGGPQFNQEYYTVDEAAELLNKKPFTVREWCRNDRLNARKRNGGRGKASEWSISRKEIERYLNHGLLPRDL